METFNVNLLTVYVGSLFKIYKEMSKTKERLIEEAFKLFASKPYDQVTFADLEKVTNLSRGAILYHIKTKENLFIEVMHYFIFHSISAASVKIEKEKTLKDFILACVEECTKEVQNMKNLGVYNINLAKLNIESQGFYFYPKMKEESINWLNNQYDIWGERITYAISNHEIKPVAIPSDIASLFINQYLGISYSGLVRDDGIDLDKLKKDLFFIYDLIKR